MSFGEDFKKFVLRGNVVDMAVGIIIGASFTTIVKSMVDDVLMPPLGLLLGKTDFSRFRLVLKAAMPDPADATKTIPEVAVRYGTFLNNILSFLIVAIATFVLIRMITGLEKNLEARAGKTPPPPGEPTEKACPECLSMIPIKATRCSHCTTKLEG
jgi:large conductance mechanosensitive channel